jgi:hypothetical protein
MADEVVRISVYEGEDVWLLGRFKTADQTDLQTTDITGDPITISIYRSSFEVKSPTASFPDDIVSPGEVWQYIPATGVNADANLATETCIQDALVTGTYWTKDSLGYNFIYKLAFNATDSAGADKTTDTSVPGGGEVVRVELSIPTDAFGTIKRVYLIDILSLQHV